MILECPLCHTRYLIPATLFASGSRQVRCARCAHSWRAELPKEINVVAPPREKPQPFDATPRAPLPPLPPGSNLPALPQKNVSKKIQIAIVASMFVVTFVLTFWLVFGRQLIVKNHPRLEGLYDAIGLHIYYPGEGLSVVGVRSEMKYEEGITKLTITGKIANETEKMQIIPDLKASAIGPDSAILQSWQIDAPTATIDPHGEVPFQSMINAPKGTVERINLNFIEPKDASN